MQKKIFSLVFSVGIKLLAVGIAIYISSWSNRFFSVQEMRSYNLALQYTSMITAILSLGVPSFLQKFYTSKDKDFDQKTVWSTMILAQSFLLFLGFFVHLAIFWLQPNLNILIFLGVYLIQFFSVLDINFRSICDVNGKTWQFNTTDLLVRILLSSLLFSYSYFGYNSWYAGWFIFSTLILYIFQFGLDWFWQKKYVGIAYPDFSIFLKHKGFFIFISLTILVGALSLNIERLFIDYFGFSANVLNGYVNAYRILEIGLLVQAVTIPSMVSYALKDNISHNKVPQNLRRVLMWGFLAFLQAILLTVGLFVMAKFGLGLIDPLKKYVAESEQVVYILLLVIIPTGIGGFISNLFVSLGRTKREFLSFFVFAVVSIILYATLIPIYGHVGAAWGALIGSLILTLTKVALAFEVQKKFKTERIN